MPSRRRLWLGSGQVRLVSIGVLHGSPWPRTSISQRMLSFVGRNRSTRMPWCCPVLSTKRFSRLDAAAGEQCDANRFFPRATGENGLGGDRPLDRLRPQFDPHDFAFRRNMDVETGRIHDISGRFRPDDDYRTGKEKQRRKTHAIARASWRILPSWRPDRAVMERKAGRGRGMQTSQHSNGSRVSLARIDATGSLLMAGRSTLDRRGV